MCKRLMVLIAVLLLTSTAPAFAQGQPQERAAAAAMAGMPSELVAAATSGVAEQMWLRFIGSPPAPTLWLFVTGGWRILDNPPYAVYDSVEEAFVPNSTLEVFVGYDDTTSVISFVVVRSK